MSRVVLSEDKDAQLLLARVSNKESELIARFAQQSSEQVHVVTETMRGVRYILVEWLQAQGFGV